MNCLVTGSTGFLGYHILPVLKENFNVRTVSLRNTAISDIDLQNIEAIVHMAGLAHQMQKIDSKLYFDVNKDQTLLLAKKAKESGGKHFIFISTVKVYGDNILEVMDEDSTCIPTDPYGQSKLEAEQGLQQLEDDNFIVSIIRPPLIYGYGVKGNLDRIIKLCKTLPVLPFAGIKNERSLVYAGNVAALILKLLGTRTSGVFIAGDRQRKSTSELVHMVSKKMNLNKPHVSIPHILRYLLKKIKPEIYQRLFGDFIVDNSKTNSKLRFTPPYLFEEGISNMVSKQINTK
ncbi:MAG: NAD-dependent epimerase/dehydratase family protein [Saprospiraceae bacterium]|jgi:UDP-glucose 4-epimerase|nr:NAD-dependent epimerase/dehydratase family protein [Saprospiraceae bacterium]